MSPNSSIDVKGRALSDYAHVSSIYACINDLCLSMHAPKAYGSWFVGHSVSHSIRL